MLSYLTSNTAKVIGACLGSVATTLVLFYPPPNTIGVIATLVVGVLGSLGLVSSGMKTTPPSA